MPGKSPTPVTANQKDSIALALSQVAAEGSKFMNGTGQILQDFRASVPQYTGRLVLQELAAVVAAAEGMRVGGKDSGIELQVHDFFMPQPVKGTRAYFMRSVLHDWPDEQCRTILGHLRNAMEPGYSKILISDCVSASKFPSSAR